MYSEWDVMEVRVYKGGCPNTFGDTVCTLSRLCPCLCVMVIFTIALLSSLLILKSSSLEVLLQSHM